MPTIKLYINNELADELPFSFAGLNTIEERTDHVIGLVEWIKGRFDLDGKDYQVFMDIHSEKIAKAMKYAKPLNIKPRKTKMEMRAERLKEEAEKIPEPFERVKGVYSNMRLYDQLY